MAQKTKTLNFVEAASAPIVSVTAWQMLFDYARVTAGQTVLIHGAAGKVGAYAVQLARQAGLHVVARPPPPLLSLIPLEEIRSSGRFGF
jgi:NADPH:quinone reductase-like Zn-dependent oxidoreductase